LLVFGGSFLLYWAGKHKDRWGDIFLFAALPLAISLIPTYFLFLRQEVPYPNFVSVRIGYQTPNIKDWLAFWGRVWGAILPLGLLCFRFLKPTHRAFHFAALLLFVLGNIILFQPIAWDNSKLFLYVYFALAGGITCLLSAFFRAHAFGKILAIVLIGVLTLTGVAELLAFWRVRDDRFQIQSPEDTRIIKVIRERTAPTDLFLSAMDINNPALLAGRPLFLGFGGWMPNFGIDQTERERDLRAIYADDPSAMEIIYKWRIKYIYLSNNEIQNWGANEAALRKRYTVFHEDNGRVIFKAQ
jgi:hypothetical protein